MLPDWFRMAYNTIRRLFEDMTGVLKVSTGHTHTSHFALTSRQKNLEIETTVGVECHRITQSGRCFAARMAIPADGVCVSVSHPPEASFSVVCIGGTYEINKRLKTRRLAKYVLASRLTQGRRSAYCRRECAPSFWSTANRRPARNGLALHRHLHGCAR